MRLYDINFLWFNFLIKSSDIWSIVLLLGFGFCIILSIFLLIILLIIAKGEEDEKR